MFTMIGNIFANLTRKPATRAYPIVRRKAPLGVRGRLKIDIDACIFCGLCQKRCPANALNVTRQPKTWTLDPYRCVVCGYCVEVCPKKCLSMDAEHRD
jgi:formate hydrogenlyase subunit 6/NADH:ubiquinone oxidoreductase subunit I